MTTGSIRVVFDTNILVSGHFWKGPPYRCMLAVDAGLATLVLSDPILTEFAEKLAGKFGVSKSEVDPIVERWATCAEVAPIERKAAWVPQDFWKTFFLTSHPAAAMLWGPIVGPIVAILSFVCSVGNIPLAAVLWNGGISFGGVIAFIYADLIVLPIIDIYRKYYGWKVTAFIFGVFYVAMATAALIVELVFAALGLIPQHRNAQIVETSITFNYTTMLNFIFLVIAACLVVRFFKTEVYNLSLVSTSLG